MKKHVKSEEKKTAFDKTWQNLQSDFTKAYEDLVQKQEDENSYQANSILLSDDSIGIKQED